MRLVKNFTPPDFRQKILHPYFHRISTVLVIKTPKKWVKMETFTPLAKILHCRRQWRQWQISPLLLSICISSFANSCTFEKFGIQTTHFKMGWMVIAVWRRLQDFVWKLRLAIKEQIVNHSPAKDGIRVCLIFPKSELSKPVRSAIQSCVSPHIGWGADSLVTESNLKETAYRKYKRSSCRV